MIYLENDFYSNFSSMVEANDEVSLNRMFVDQISNLIAYKKSDLVSLFGKVGINVSKNPTNKELANLIAKNIKSNKKLQIGIAYLIAEDNDILQQEFKKGRPSDDTDAFEGEKDKKPKEPKKPRKPVDWNKSADAVTSIAGSISVLADTLTQTKTGQLADDLSNQANVKSPEEIVKEQEAKSLADKKKKRQRNIIIGVVAVGLIVTAYFGYKKGWFGKGESLPN
jgi:hypothetical protein